MDTKDRIVIFSGEGEVGTFERLTGDLDQTLQAKRAGGDRWARAFKYLYESDGGSVYEEIGGSDRRIIPDFWINVDAT